jgi:hypothetical protein
MSDPTFNEFLIGALQALAARPVTNRKELAAWRLEADRLESSFTPEQANGVPQFVWHYLGDADIRLRNAGYRANQERQLQRVLRELGPRTHQPGPRRRH